MSSSSTAPVGSSIDSATIESANPDNHRTSLTVQLLIRIASSATDEQVEKADELRHEWQKNLVMEAKSETEQKSKKKKVEVVKLTLSPNQAYHVEFSLPCENSFERPPDKQYVKFYLDIINLQYMAKVYYGSKSDVPVKNAVDDSATKLFRYFRRAGHTYCYLEVDFDWLVTESVVRRLATHTLLVEVFDSPDKLSQRAKMDFRAAKKIALPHFAEFSLTEKQTKEFASAYGEKEKTGAAKIEWLVTHLFEQHLSAKPKFARRAEPPLFSLVPPSSEESVPSSPPETLNVAPLPRSTAGGLLVPAQLQPATSKKVLSQKAKLEQVAAKIARRKVEATKTPVMTFHTLTSTLFLPGNLTVMRGSISYKVGPANDDNTELISTVFDGLFRLAVKDGELLSIGQQIHLNPFTISIQSIEGLPDKPVSFTSLEETCHPVFVEFNRFGLEAFRTIAQPHAAALEWKEPTVTFMDQMDPELLREFLVVVGQTSWVSDELAKDDMPSSKVWWWTTCRVGVDGIRVVTGRGDGVPLFTGPPLEVRVHDRDRKDGTCENSYGVAKVDLFPLLAHNLKEMDYDVPVIPHLPHRANWIVQMPETCSLLKAPDPNDPANQQGIKDSKKSKKTMRKLADKPATVGTAATGKTTVHTKGKEMPPPALLPVSALPPGRYQDAKTTLKMHISVAFPLKHFIDSNPATGSTPFCRYILVLPADVPSEDLVDSICSFVDCLNAETLNLTDYQRICFTVQNDLMTFPAQLADIIPDENAPQVTLLSGTSAPAKLDFDKTNTITGFHVFDGERHIVIVEGLHAGGLAKFAAFMDDSLEKLDVASCAFLWDSRLRFSKRLYSDFGARLFPIQLNKPLRLLSRKPYLKMAKIFPPQVTFAVHQLCQMAYCTKIPRDLVKNRLFPSAAHLRDIRTYLGQVFEPPQCTVICA